MPTDVATNTQNPSGVHLAARRYAPASFGIATECGMARARSEATVRALLQIHADVLAG